MPGRSGRTGIGQAPDRIGGTSTKESIEQSAFRVARESVGDVAEVGGLSFMRGKGQDSRYRSRERRQLLEGSDYVDLWDDWEFPDGTIKRVDYGLFNFLADCCLTFIEATPIGEQAEGVSQIMPLPQPSGKDDDYYSAICYVGARWQTERLLAVPKSRRMIMSWYFRCCDFWDILMHSGRMIYVASEDLEKSEEMVYRMKWLYDHVPNDKIPRSCLPRLQTNSSKSHAGRKDLLNRVWIMHSEQEPGAMDSWIQAVSQNDDLRGIGSGRITLEEFAKWKNAKEKWSGLIPTLQGVAGPNGEYTGGQVVMVSTARTDTHMGDLVQDKAS